MAKFQAELPTEVIKDMNTLAKDLESILSGMTKAGAEYVAGKVKATVPHPDLANHVKVSRSYKTPSDGGINTKVYFSGYIPFKPPRTTFSRRGKAGGSVYVTKKGIPAEFLANVYEHGRSNAPFPKKPFFRKAFKDATIEEVMLEEQRKLSGGLLE